MAPLDNPSIPKGSIVLVTGASGLIASNIVDQFLHYGYKVRGTVRDPKKSAWLAKLFDEKYGKENFELVAVPEMMAEGAFDEAVKGVSAVIHTASPMTFDSNPHNVIPVAIAGAVNALKATYTEPGVKRFVFTSSSTSVVISKRDTPGIVVTEETWNEDSIKQAWADPPYGPERSSPVYAASKTQAEQEVWKFHKENQQKRPDLVVNTVLPNTNFGKSLNPIEQGYPSTSGMPVALWKGDEAQLRGLGTLAPQYFVNVQDSARLHVAAALFADVKDERIFAFAGRFSWDTILDIFRKAEPNRKFADNFSSGDDPNEIQPRARAEQLLRELGEPGWVSLEQTILELVEQLRASE
ncbi:hypothetical protein MRS44_007048 [Fusarium solani]|uniref:NAD-dependent epimerase/dehydratase domain-containing protein n=1 Tax=Fusarium solani TaxID=169388 RepID=A0A9P9L5N7_FUSSL|nr:uncharacterized protein B0J15DRAFT_518536 [Fusarium solani]KAH7274693.1 hypothetical protein B0J15DRAFT_518536 [Fusarium solani]KAJ3466390.1 hypothetical protein MRS44_007048 [Fusarium solani]